MTRVIGVPKEIKDQEGRVSMQPDGISELVHHGHEVVVETQAGTGAGFSDEEYKAAGARILDGPDEVFDEADLIVKVKEPVPEEYDRYKEGQELFTYLHLAADKELTEFLMDRKINSIAYETVEFDDGTLPLLKPMSEVAGRMATQAAARCLESPQGGAGLLLGGVPGTPAARVTIIGGGVVGTEAAKIALGMRAIVRVLDIDPVRLAYLSDIFEGRADLVIPNRARTAAYVEESDVVIGAVLVHGAEAPKLVSREMIKNMKDGSVAVDVAIDQGGCIETAKPTTHSRPDLHRRGRSPLLRGEHPRGGSEDLHVGANERDATLPVADSRQGSRRSCFRKPGARQRPQHARWGVALRAGRRGPRSATFRCKQAPELKTGG